MTFFLLACTPTDSATDTGHEHDEADADTDTDADTDADTDTDTGTDIPTDVADGAAVCEASPCGGDLTGGWTLSGGCVDGEQQAGECAGEWYTVSRFDAAGSITFAGDGTYTLDAKGSTTVISSFTPESCLAGRTCADIAAEYGATCASGEDGTGCACSLELPNNDPVKTGTWVAASNAVTLTPDGGEAASLDYCVEGDAAWFLTEAIGFAVGSFGVRQGGN